jgi:cytochrome b subunit of formate dehydrogenase
VIFGPNKWLQLISAFTALISALSLYYGSLAVPWKTQTFGGKSDAEREWARRQKIMKWVGIPCALISCGCEIIDILISN